MAKLEVSADLLLDTLFGKTSPGRLTITEARMLDPERRVLEFEIVGSDVPECDRVCALRKKQQLTTEFLPI